MDVNFCVIHFLDVFPIRSGGHGNVWLAICDSLLAVVYLPLSGTVPCSNSFIEGCNGHFGDIRQSSCMVDRIYNIYMISISRSDNGLLHPMFRGCHMYPTLSERYGKRTLRRPGASSRGAVRH
jgi:hypothetical protein